MDRCFEAGHAVRIAWIFCDYPTAMRRKRNAGRVIFSQVASLLVKFLEQVYYEPECSCAAEPRAR